VGVGIFGLIVVSVGGVFAFYAKAPNPNNQIPNNQTEIVTEIPKESPKPVEQQSYKIEILNGSGVTGAAAASAEELGKRNQELVITTGNAGAQTGTTIKYKTDLLKRSGVAGVISELYPSAKASVESGLATDVQIVLGK
jgi:hypothetical protein